MALPPIPPDDHTHSEWSWDARDGSMEGSCARAVELGLPSIAFTEHVDGTRWIVPEPARVSLAAEGFPVGGDGRFDPDPLDVEGYLASIERCRQRFPTLQILTGVELGEPHRFAEEVQELLGAGTFDRVIGSLHSVEVAGEAWLVDDLLGPHAPAGITPEQVVRAYLREATTMVREMPDEVQVLGHVDYPVRRWEGRFEPADFEEEFRALLAALAFRERALEINTRVPLAAEIVGWWRDVGGKVVSFGSDAHEPSAVAAGLAEAADMAAAFGFRADRHPHGFWRR